MWWCAGQSTGGVKYLLERGTNLTSPFMLLATNLVGQVERVRLYGHERPRGRTILLPRGRKATAADTWPDCLGASLKSAGDAVVCQPVKSGYPAED